MSTKDLETLKVNVSKRKVMGLGGEEGLECEVCVDEEQLEPVSEFKYLGCFERIRYRWGSVV